MASGSSDGAASGQQEQEVPDATVSTDVEASGKFLGFRTKGAVRATGLWAACLAAAAGTAISLVSLDHTNPQHFLLMCFNAAISGALFVSAVTSGRIADALKDKELYRAELQRVTKEKAKLESALIRNRQSSAHRLPARKRSAGDSTK